MYSNAEILSAVIVKWAQPLINTLAASNLNKMPFLYNIEEKIKASGWVGAQWSLANELSPFFPSVANAVIAPMVRNTIENLSDEQIPAFAYGVVDKAIENGSLEVLDGKVKFNKEDLLRLKELLRMNLPLPTESYKVIERNEIC